MGAEVRPPLCSMSTANAEKLARTLEILGL
jgi:hypothetical protein